MLPLVIFFSLGIGAVILYTVGRFVVDRKGLRRFPSPSIAAFTLIWLMHYSWLGRRYKAVDAAHRKLGSVVHIAPYNISFTDHVAYKDIYGHGSPILKDHFYAHIAAGNPSMSQTLDRAEHTRKRKNMAYIFSAKETTAMEPRIVGMIRKLCRDLQVKSNGGVIAETDKHAVIEGVFDLRPWLNMFSYDAITSMFWSNTYGFLDKGNGMCPSMDVSGKVNPSPADLVQGLAISAPIHTHGKQAAQNFSGMARYQVVKRLENPPDKPDLFSNLPVQPTEKRSTPMSLNELIAECTTMLDAGSDTTQTSLTNCMYQLASNPEKQTRLYNLLISAVNLDNSSQPIAPYSEVQKVPYLRACLDESFRCKPPVAFGLPRQTVALRCHDREPFRATRYHNDNDEHRNGCTTSQQEHQNLKESVLPFSLGGRACIGRNLAYMELSIMIAALVMGFEWELAVPGSELQTIERLNCNPKRTSGEGSYEGRCGFYGIKV